MTRSPCKLLMHSNVFDLDDPHEITRKSVNIFTPETLLHLHQTFEWKSC